MEKREEKSIVVIESTRSNRRWLVDTIQVIPLQFFLIQVPAVFNTVMHPSYSCLPLIGTKLGKSAARHPLTPNVAGGVDCLPGMWRSFR